MKIVFCTTCKNRTGHLRQSLPQNLADNVGGYLSSFYKRDRWYGYECKTIVLDYGSQDDLAEFLHAIRDSGWIFPHLEPQRGNDNDTEALAVYSFPDPGKFQMAHAKNMAHRLGILEGADILVNVDADNFTGQGFASYLANEFASSGESMFMYGHMVKGKLPRGISGRIAVTRNAFLKAGGYDERFETWSPDDKDFNLRLRRLGYEHREIDERFLGAILHNDRIRFKEYPEAHAKMTGEDEFESVAKCTTTISNWGKIGTGVVYRNFDFSRPIVLGPLPTRIFGIGLHKTATTSLHHALEILGFDSAHWKSAHWAKRIWREMRQSGRSATVESHYALCDLPIPLLYQELDKAYPGSKFILTMRDENKWLDSIRRHWDPEHNPFRSAWDSDPFSHRVHRLLYGRKDFDSETFLARYRRHNREVLNYFKERPQDLLVMDMDDGAGWPELCRFLGRPIPTTPYPQAFRTAELVASMAI